MWAWLAVSPSLLKCQKIDQSAEELDNIDLHKECVEVVQELYYAEKDFFLVDQIMVVFTTDVSWWDYSLMIKDDRKMILQVAKSGTIY